MASQYLELISTDEEIFEIEPKFAKKSGMLMEYLEAMGYVEGGPLPAYGLPLNTLRAETLRPIVQWLYLHEKEEPKDVIYRHQHKDDLKVADADMALFDSLYPRDKLADVINAAYFLDMPDLEDTLKKYTAHHLKGKNRSDAIAWLEIATSNGGKAATGGFKELLG
ncbi:hypothetical protein L596_000822 [Steinernema carpocapsae]|uniref:SKP1 component POZ domain-containing protein n=1 Tax=Steinernema carpocapsae TaxID=34508 RepID=A0A4U8UNF7_STECR|nr:hypothetical protein L596_000822 [Steinernema carpocapsae]